MSEDRFGGNNPGGFNFSDIRDGIREGERIHREFIESMEVDNSEEYEYRQEFLQTLKNIETNTAGLQDITLLLSKSLGNQEEILAYLTEALAISTSTTTEEAESKWRQLMNKASNLTADVETIQKLNGFANTIYKLFMDNQ